ncbi:very short patch repair endonuclease [Oricola sp.]|uniref:very short patch repair endonuclease n=1 Tax=Oricola sp. TaxID=1979950 RepID=UPI0025D549FD|nr:very short patch repair endonuclease [Oricola sp.]MCI5074406.1 very short patch repair endonuclease [Oricola sp.]
MGLFHSYCVRMDIFPPEKRSKVMAAVRREDTAPEMVVRRGLHALGFRYSLHCKGVKGKPDLCLRKHRALIWVNGCFWHGHGCAKARVPQTNRAYWAAKFERNKRRDAQNLEEAEEAGWRNLVVWECALTKGRAPETVKRVADWILSGSRSDEIP